jgi:SAM-dependent methyltransferase
MKNPYSEFTLLSDEKYKRIKEAGVKNFDELQDHNLIRNASRELGILFSIAEVHWKPIARKRALDLCCGAGFMTASIAELGFSVIGIDVNEDAIELAKEAHPSCKFVAGDATNPTALIQIQGFDFILVREAHPFSRLDNFEFQRDTVNRYLSLLKPGGLIVIAHARRGGGMFSPSVDFKRLGQDLGARGIETMGPYYISLIKRLSKRPGKVTLIMLSLIASIIGRILGIRLIEAYFIHKPA